MPPESALWEEIARMAPDSLACKLASTPSAFSESVTNY
jgi:hypothetical protein